MAPSVGDDIRACLRFYSRLPVATGRDGHGMPDFSRVSWATPIAGAIIGAIGAAALLTAAALGLPAFVSATGAVGALILATGGLHEDGLADLADGFGGGATREEKLAIMRDSRLGSYGVLALCVATLLRVGAVAALVERGILLAVFCVIVAAAVSRAVGLIPLALLRPARADGAGSSAATPSAPALRVALCLGSAIALAPVFGGAALSQTVVAVMAAFAGAIVVTRLAERQVGGYTGDVLGAVQQIAEISALVALSAG